VHLAALVFAVEAAKRFAPDVDAAYNAAAAEATAVVDAAGATGATNATNATAAEFVHPLDAPFHPSLVNTVSFLVNMFIQTTTILVNYIGEPFCVSLRNNTPLLYSVVGAYVLLLTLLSETVTALNQSMEMVPIPVELTHLIAAAMVVDLVACWLVERLFAAAFPARQSKVALALAGRGPRV
jgi:magnesium-transporting ATPase (P-type)